jgi:hypothetical protein
MQFKEEAAQLLQAIIAQDLAADRVEEIRKALVRAYHDGKGDGAVEVGEDPTQYIPMMGD